jgi:hypothetical protein
MKQATSEASTSVIVVTAVALLTAVFFTMIWPTLKGRMIKNSNCSNAICDVGYINTSGHEHYGEAACYAPPSKQELTSGRWEKEIFYCPYRG